MWRWIWLAAAVGFGTGEIALAGTFVFAPFGAGAAVAAVTSFAGAPVGLSWVAFIAASLASVVAFQSFARRMDVGTAKPAGAGAGRLLGEGGIVLEAVPPGPDALGLVRVGREEWRAQSVDGSPLATSTPVTVLEVRGTRLVVAPTGSPLDPLPTERPLS